ncbi:uncharacterized protein LOC133910224 [Phragmites australis]|uniref:uncharacterized protein LOC133910224 n=1 Tax=Phragmites australis TaxID=29695 RepID=UPI002D798C0A|nr:uncharacterized protein LOC133910224 [Phragmites australis]
MECNKDDAIRSKEIAERKFRENDIAGAKKFALKAKALFKPLEGIDQMLLNLDVLLRAQTKIGGENDWYGILEVSPLVDEEAIKKQYKKLALQTHPDKNSSICADDTFNIISDAWSVLSDTTKRMAYDQKRHMCGPGVNQNNYKANANSTSNSSMSSMNGFWRQNSCSDRPRKVVPHQVLETFGGRPRKVVPHQVPDTFWTYCGSCFVSFQYSREYVNRYLKCPVCHAVFVAVEVPPPSSPIYPNGPKPTATVPDMATPVQAGVACDNQNYDPTVLQQWSFLKSTTCAHSTRYTVQQTHESVRKQEVGEANIAANEQANIHRTVMQAVRKHAHAGSSLGRANVETREHEAAKRRCVTDGKKVTWQSASSCPDGNGRKPMRPAKRRPRSTTETPGAKKRKVSSGDLFGESSGSAGRTSFGRALMQLDICVILIENTKLQVRERLEEFNSKKANVKNKEKMQISKKNSKKSSTRITCSAAIDVNETEMKQSSTPVHPKEDNAIELVSKRVHSEEKERAQSSKQVGLEEKEKSWQWRKPEVHIVYTRRNHKGHKKELGDDATGANSATQHHLADKYSCLNQEVSSDEGSSEMPVPDADFYNFGDHSESSFQSDQVWAVYDEEDGMPRYYALIRKVLSTHPFKVRLAYLKANGCNEFGASNWITCGYSKTCGEFKVGVSEDTDHLNAFSHNVKCEKGPGGIIRILPKKGDIWALYQNWSPDWDEFTPDDTMYKYELVEVLDSYHPTEGISVRPIVKIPGFVSVFKPLHDPIKSWRIPKEMLRFSHQVPFHLLTGEEAHNAPKGCYELDPGSTPKELLHVVPPSDGAK